MAKPEEELVIGFGKGKPGGKDEASDPMGKPAPEETSEFENALDDAFEAVKSDDKQAFKDALGAAIASKCAEMYADDGDEAAPKSEQE